MSDSQHSPAQPGGEPLEQEIEKNLLIQQAINSVLRISLEPISLDEQMHRVLELLIKLPWLALEAQGCIFLVEGDSKELVMKAHIGMPAGVLSTCSRVPFGTCLCGRAIATSGMVYASCIDECHTTLYPGILPHGHYCVPIACGERRIGLLNLYVREGHRQVPLEERFLRAVADVLAGIIEHQRTQERLQEQLHLAAFGRDVGLALSQGDSLPDTLRQCAEALVRHLDGAFARIWTLNEAEGVLELQASAGLYTHTDGAHCRVPVGRYKIGLIAQERKPHLTNAVLGDPRVHDQEWARREGLVAFAGYPLLVEDRLVGVLAMFARHPLSEATLDAMASVANGIALGIERKRAEGRLREQREWLRVTLASIGDAVIATDTQGRITFLNPVAQDLTGWTQDEAQRRPLEDVFHILHEQTRQPIENQVAKVIRDGVVGLGNQTVLVARDGTERPIDDSAAPIRGGQGRIVGAVLVFRDVSERRRVEEDRFRLAAIVESSEDAIIGKTLDGMIWSWNRGAERLYGYSAAEVRGKPISLLIPPDHPDDWPGILEKLQRGERIDHYETVRVRKGGTLVEVSVTFSPIKDATGKIVGVSAIARDLSQRRRAEQLVEANRRKDEFLALLSHELRNPLASVRHGLQVMNQLGKDDTPLEKVRAVMERQVRHLSRLVDDLLDVSRITLGTIRLYKEQVSLATVVQEAVEISRPLIEARHHQLNVSLPQPLVWLEADPVRLVQILTNLLHNAAQYTEEGGHIGVLAEREGNQVVLRVRDTGMGIPGERLPRLFEPFQKPCPLPGRSPGGLGIGLSLVRRLVDLHGGTVEASSLGPGQGSELVVRLPAAGAERPEHTLPKPLQAIQPVLSFPKRRILIVDDDRDAAKMLATSLRLEGHEVRVASSGPKALAIAQQEPPGVILLDLGMPGMDGYEVAQRLRAALAFKEVLLVALTGYGQEADRRRCEQAGFDGHLVKPVEPGALKQLLAHGKIGCGNGSGEGAEVGP